MSPLYYWGMPQCKNCHRNISSFDHDICPYCGERNPIQTDYRTKDITQFVDPVSEEYKLYKSKSKKMMVILMASLGMFGVPYFYIGKFKNAVICLSISVLSILGFGFLLFFTCLGNAWAFLIPFFALFVFYACFSLTLLHNDTLKDANGEFLR